MTNYLDILRNALADPRLDDLSSVNNISDQRLKSFPGGCYISEWRFGMGEIRYEYRLHKKELGEELKRAFINRNRGGHPKLTAVFSIGDLRKIITPQEARSEYL